MKDKFLQIKKWVIEAVIWAEKNLKGKSGPEKKAFVIEKVVTTLINLLPMPWYVRWAKEAASRRIICWITDLAVERLNFLTSWNFDTVELNDLQVAELACALDAPISAIAISCTSSSDILSARIDALYQEYAISPNVLLPGTVDEPALPLTSNYDNQLSKNLTRKEIACRDNCGFDLLTWETVDTFQAFREFVNQPIIIQSGSRCPDRNVAVGGSKNSKHMTGQALDIYVKGLNQRQLGEMAKKAQGRGLLPNLSYVEFVANSDTAIHIDTGETRNKMFNW